MIFTGLDLEMGSILLFAIGTVLLLSFGESNG